MLLLAANPVAAPDASRHGKREWAEEIPYIDQLSDIFCGNLRANGPSKDIIRTASEAAQVDVDKTSTEICPPAAMPAGLGMNIDKARDVTWGLYFSNPRMCQVIDGKGSGVTYMKRTLIPTASPPSRLWATR